MSDPKKQIVQLRDLLGSANVLIWAIVGKESLTFKEALALAEKMQRANAIAQDLVLTMKEQKPIVAL